MGCDGGTIPRRDELVRVAKKPEQVSVVTLILVLLFNLLSCGPLAERQGIRAGLPLASLRYHAATIAAADRHVRPGSPLLQAERNRASAGEGQNARLGETHQESARRQEPEVDRQSELQGLQQIRWNAGRP